MQLSPEILEIHGQLNSSNLVDGKWYRRNHNAYEFICYVNNIVALLSSNNTENISVFIDRVLAYMDSSQRSNLSPEYIALVDRYVELVSEIVIKPGLTPHSSGTTNGAP